MQRVGASLSGWVPEVERHQRELFPRVGFIVTNLSYRPKRTMKSYNGRGTAELWIKEGKYALIWTRLSYRMFVANQVSLWLFIPACNLPDFLQGDSHCRIPIINTGG